MKIKDTFFFCKNEVHENKDAPAEITSPHCVKDMKYVQQNRRRRPKREMR